LAINETKDLKGEIGVRDATCLFRGRHCQSWSKFSMKKEDPRAEVVG